MKKTAFFFLFLFILAFIEWLGHHFTAFSVKDWYLTLEKPFWNPPGYVFGPVWTFLYLMIAVAGWRIALRSSFLKERKEALVVYAVQLVLNLLWSFFFFFLQSPFLALIDILVLFILIISTMRLFYSLDRVASFLLFPYCLWTFYAVILNFAIWNLNRAF